MFTGKKQAQGGGNAALLLLLIGALILFYILLLPDDDRAELLNSTDDDNDDDDRRRNQGKLLFNATPGLLLTEDEDDVKHNAGTVAVFVRSAEVNLAEASLFTISSARENTRSIPIRAGGVIRNAQLTFTILEGSGTLFVLVDGEEVFSGEPEGQVNPISLKDLSPESVVQFRVDSPGWWQFFSTNAYEISNLQLIATQDTFDAQQGTTSFVVTRDEINRAESGHIAYFTSCPANSQSGNLRVSLNGRTLFSGIADCNTAARHELFPQDLIEGRNELSFFTTAGSYLLDRITITIQVEDALPPTYFFNLDEDEYEDVEEERDNISIHFDFIDNNERKSFELNVNNAKFSIDTKNKSYVEDIPASAIREGANAVTLTPRRSFVLPLLEVFLS